MLAHDIRRPRSSKADKKIRALTEDEQKAFTECVTGGKVPSGRNDYRCQLLISLYSGMRMGEVNALSPADIDFKQNVVHVRKTISMDMKGRGFLGDGTKTYAGVRDIPISKTLRPVLEDALEKMKPNKEGLVFYDHLNDRVITTSNVNSYYKRVCDKCGVECKRKLLNKFIYHIHIAWHIFAINSLITVVVFLEAFKKNDASGFFITKESNGFINFLLEISEAYYVTVSLDAVKDSVCSGERLNQSMHLKILINPQSIECCRIKASKSR